MFNKAIGYQCIKAIDYQCTHTVNKLLLMMTLSRDLPLNKIFKAMIFFNDASCRWSLEKTLKDWFEVRKLTLRC